MRLPEIHKTDITKKIIIIVILIAIGWWLKGRFTPNFAAMMGGMQKTEPYVLTQQVEQKEILPSRSYIANVEAIKAVDLRPQITGYIEKVLFKEGSFVNEGDILFVIEQDRYQATLDLRTAELKKAEAILYQADRNYKRQVSLNKQKFVSEANLDTAKSDFLQAEASVRQAKANLELAKIDLNYTVIKAPISGYIGKALVTEGNYVNSSTQVLARIVQVDPIRVVFSMTDKDFLNARLEMDENKKLRTKLILPNGEVIDNHVISHFANNEANTTTATIAAYIEYENKENLLIPGNYVNVLIGTGQPQNSLLISQAALAQDENGTYVFVVNNEGNAEQRRVELGEVYDSRQIVTSGLKPTDKVIIKGQQKITQGQKVKADEIPLHSKDINPIENPAKQLPDADQAKVAQQISNSTGDPLATDDEIEFIDQSANRPNQNAAEQN